MRFTILLLAFLSVSTACATAPSEQENLEALNYLPKDAIPIATALPQPYAFGSTGDRAELDQLLEIQSTRTKAECARATSEARASFKSFFGTPYGPLTQAEIARWTSFFERVEKDASYFIGQEKHLWRRERPYIEEAAIHPCVPHVGLGIYSSYPSGHSTLAHLFADMLDVMMPERKALFDARADQIATDRVLGGVHHPSDIVAGKDLGGVIFNALEKSPRFEDDLRAAIGTAANVPARSGRN